MVEGLQNKTCRFSNEAAGLATDFASEELLQREERSSLPPLGHLGEPVILGERAGARKRSGNGKALCCPAQRQRSEPDTPTLRCSMRHQLKSKHISVFKYKFGMRNTPIHLEQKPFLSLAAVFSSPLSLLFPSPPLLSSSLSLLSPLPHP